MSGHKPFSILRDGFSEERKKRIEEEKEKLILEMESQTSAYSVYKDLKHRILIQWSEKENCYLVFLPDFSKEKKWFACGDSYEEALKNGLEQMRELILKAEHNDELPPPVPEI